MIKTQMKLEKENFQENGFTLFLERSISRFCEWSLPWNHRSSFYEKKSKELAKDLCNSLVNEINQYCPEIYSWINEDKNYCDKISISLLSSRLINEEVTAQLTTSLTLSLQNLSHSNISDETSKSNSNISDFIQTWRNNGRLKLPPSLIPEKTYQILLQSTLNKTKNNEIYQTLCNHIILSLISAKFDSKLINEILKDQSNRFDVTPIPWKDISIIKIENYLNHVVANNL